MKVSFILLHDLPHFTSILKNRNKIGRDHEDEHEPHTGALPSCLSSLERLRSPADVGVASGAPEGCRATEEDGLRLAIVVRGGDFGCNEPRLRVRVVHGGV